MTNNKVNSAAGAVSLKVLAERKVEGINKTTQFKVDQQIINVVPGFNGRPIDPAHVASIKLAKLAGAVFPPLFVNVDNGRIDLVDGEHRLTADLELIAEGHEIGPVDCMQFKGSDLDRIEQQDKRIEQLTRENAELKSYLDITTDENGQNVIGSRIKQLEQEKAELRTAFHVNMLRLFPDKSHEEIASTIDGSIANPTIKDSLTVADQSGN